MNIETKTYTNRFMNRRDADAFAKANDAKVERCPATGANRDGFFKYQVITVGRGTRQK